MLIYFLFGVHMMHGRKFIKSIVDFVIKKGRGYDTVQQRMQPKWTLEGSVGEDR
jgi:hypothetical protein